MLGFVFLMMAFKTQLKMPQMTRGDAAYARLLPYKVACWGILAAGMFVDLLWSKQFWLSWMLLAIAVRATSEARERDSEVAPESVVSNRPLETMPYWKVQGLR